MLKHGQGTILYSRAPEILAQARRYSIDLMGNTILAAHEWVGATSPLTLCIPPQSNLHPPSTAKRAQLLSLCDTSLN